MAGKSSLPSTSSRRRTGYDTSRIRPETGEYPTKKSRPGGSFSRYNDAGENTGQFSIGLASEAASDPTSCRSEARITLFADDSATVPHRNPNREFFASAKSACPDSYDPLNRTASHRLGRRNDHPCQQTVFHLADVVVFEIVSLTITDPTIAKTGNDDKSALSKIRQTYVADKTSYPTRPASTRLD